MVYGNNEVLTAFTIVERVVDGKSSLKDFAMKTLMCDFDNCKRLIVKLELRGSSFSLQDLVRWHSLTKAITEASNVSYETLFLRAYFQQF